MRIEWAVFSIAVLFASPSHVVAHGDDKQKQKPKASAKAEQKEFGIAGDPKRVTRTITVDMSEMRFAPGTLEVKRGDTVRFIVRNRGTIMHEMVIGTMHELEEHAALMKKFPGMEHDEPYMAHVSPGKSGEIVWNFNRAGEFNFGCLAPGHFEAGMVGKVIVR